MPKNSELFVIAGSVNSGNLRLGIYLERAGRLSGRGGGCCGARERKEAGEWVFGGVRKHFLVVGE